MQCLYNFLAPTMNFISRAAEAHLELTRLAEYIHVVLVFLFSACEQLEATRRRHCVAPIAYPMVLFNLDDDKIWTLASMKINFR